MGLFDLFAKKPTIHWIALPDFGWKLEKDEFNVQLWVHPERSAAISLNFFDKAPDIPLLEDIAGLRNFYRKHAIAANGGLIEVSISKLQGFAAVKTILKIPQEPKGTTYLASLILPFRDCSFVIKVQAFEVVATGMRDTIILDQLMETGVVKLRDRGLIGWQADPYDPDFIGGTLMNLGEKEAYDSQFPDHPLSQARAWLSSLQTSLTFKDELLKLKGFGK